MHTPLRRFAIADRMIGADQPTYFIADIAANHDGDLERAKALIHLAAEAGAEAAKFQHFSAKTIVSDRGFRELGGKRSHQAAWSGSVYEIYDRAALDPAWTEALLATCEEAGIHFFSSPYAVALVDHLDPFVPAYKIGSGDVTWPQFIDYVASKGKPVLIACGASSMDETIQAVEAALGCHGAVALMQCNTNYSGKTENFIHINLRVLESLRIMYPKMVLGLSDHTPGYATVLGAVALGARVIEKHFTDDPRRLGPDHAFSMTPISWRDMVLRTRELELALGDGIKRVEGNEQETVVVQRRALRLRRDLAAGTILDEDLLIPLRPCPPEALTPVQLDAICGRRLRHAMKAGRHLTWMDLQS